MTQFLGLLLDPYIDDSATTRIAPRETPLWGRRRSDAYANANDGCGTRTYALFTHASIRDTYDLVGASGRQALAARRTTERKAALGIEQHHQSVFGWRGR